MHKSLDIKLANIHADPVGNRDFILADAKDADMAAGLAAPGKDARTGKVRSLADYRDQMREVLRQGLIDILLMSASTMELLAIRERLFENSHVTPAARANDTTDIHLPAGGTYGGEPSRPFRTATLEQIQYGRVDPAPGARKAGADLGLYSITPNNRLEFDYPTMQAYKDFRIEAERAGFRHFLEVFDPNACGDRCPADLGRFINDLIVRTLAGVPSTGRPIFLKIAYHGPRAMEELAAYDPHLVPGILGGSSGTTHDAFKLLEDAKRHGARAALFGRKINNSEHQLTFVSYLRAIADSQVSAGEAVRAYHGDLQRLGIKPYRDLKADIELTTTATSYAGTAGGTSASSKPLSLPKQVALQAGETANGDRPRPRVTFGSGGSGAARSTAPSGAGGSTTATPARSTPRVTFGGGSPPQGGSSRPAQAQPAPRPMEAKPAASPATAPQPLIGNDGGFPVTVEGKPDYKAMTPAQKVAFARQQIKSDVARNGDSK